jgi:hypothetical protein
MYLPSNPVPGSSKKYVIVVGAGLAGAEAAWQAANNGARVKLYEMRPKKQTPAHNTGEFAELVCSNSFRAAALENAVGILKEEMRLLGSLIMTCADKTRVPAGGALAVDRELFAACWPLFMLRLAKSPGRASRRYLLKASTALEPRGTILSLDLLPVILT